MASEARDYSKPPETEYVGREYTAELTFFVVEDASEAEIEEWLAYELGSGSISNDHPMINACLNEVSVYSVRRGNYRKFIDWPAADSTGRRTGKVRLERDVRVSA